MKAMMVLLSASMLVLMGCQSQQKSSENEAAPPLEIEEEFPALKKGEIAYLNSPEPTVVARYKETSGQLVSEKCDNCEALNLAKEMHLMSANYIERLSFCRSHQGAVKVAKIYGVGDTLEICVLENGDFFRIN